jgi:hypothetical protein
MEIRLIEKRTAFDLSYKVQKHYRILGVEFWLTLYVSNHKTAAQYHYDKLREKKPTATTILASTQLE